MIIPSRRFMFWSLLTIMPFTTIAFALPEYTEACIFFSSLLPLLALIDVIVSNGLLQELGVKLPDKIRITARVIERFDIEVDRGELSPFLLKLGLSTPNGIHLEPREQQVLLPKDSKTASISLQVWADKRGSYRFENVHVERSSSLGLWHLRSTTAANCELIVYPNLIKDNPNVSEMFLDHGEFGMHSFRVAGQGKEFELLRNYIPGDSYGDIDWKATARKASPITRVHQIEHTQEIYVAVDHSRLTAREFAITDKKLNIDHTGKPSILEKHINAALILCLAAKKMDDHFGLLVFSDKVTRFLKAGKGKNHYRSCQEQLYRLDSDPTSPNFDALFSFIISRIPRRALIIILTSLDDPVISENYTRCLQLANRKHLLVTGMLKSDNTRPLFDDKEESPGDLHERLAAQLRWDHTKKLELELKPLGVTLLLLDHESMCPTLLKHYMHVKSRQLL